MGDEGARRGVGKTEHTEGDDAYWIEDVAPEEIVREIDLEARERLGMTFEEFVRAYRQGTLEDTTATNELVISLRLVDKGENP